jgi:peptidyl-prolyl cis-trans isomerase A (cyclophilin A)
MSNYHSRSASSSLLLTLLFYTLLASCALAHTHHHHTAHAASASAALGDRRPYHVRFTIGTNSAADGTPDASTQQTFVVEIKPDWAPIGAARFRAMLENAFLVQAPFFRTIDHFMTQFGLPADPGDNHKLAEPAANKKFSDSIADEANADFSGAGGHARKSGEKKSKSNSRGYLSFAHAGAGSRTTQMFINFKDNASLDRQGFTPFGRVVEGMEVVDRIYSGYGDSPDQNKVRREGKPYLQRHFPLLTYIVSIHILPRNTISTPKAVEL